jgi:amidohydrolase
LGGRVVTGNNGEVTGIPQRAMAMHDKLVDWRRAIHQWPELAFEEVKTAALIAENLARLGIRAETGVAKTGVVGYLGTEGPTVALRADMDALPIEELNDVPYRSQVSEVMHACGHDSHVAMALGAAELLSQEDLRGQVRFLFQPSEESVDEEGRSGAARMVEEGVLDGVDAVIALHVHDEVETGVIKAGSGPVCASVDSFEAAVIGKGCHGAYPHLGVDPVFISGQVISAVNAIVSRQVGPVKTAVISIGAIHGGDAFNVIPAEVQMKGTIRSFEEEVRAHLHAQLEGAFAVSRSLGGDYRLTIHKYAPPLVNDAKVSAVFRRVGEEMLGVETVLPMGPEMGGEDFAFMARKVAGAMFGLGVRKGDIRQAHSPHFDIDEGALPIGVGMLAESAKRLLLMLA